MDEGGGGGGEERERRKKRGEGGGARMMGEWEGRRADVQVRESAATRDGGAVPVRMRGRGNERGGQKLALFLIRPTVQRKGVKKLKGKN